MKKIFISLILGAVVLSGCVAVNNQSEECGSAGFFDGYVGFAGEDYKVVGCTDTGNVRFMKVDDSSGNFYKVVPKLSPEGMDYFELELTN